MITPTEQADGTYLDPKKSTPVDPKATDNVVKNAQTAIADREKSERIVLGCFMATGGKRHREAVLKHRRSDPVYGLYVKICNNHPQRDASQSHEAWLQFFGIRRSASEPYMSLYHRVEAAYDKIERITPANQSPNDRASELQLFGILNSLSHNGPLRMSLTAQGNLSLTDAAAAMLRVDTGKKLAKSELEQTHAVQGGSCWTCGERDHFSHNAPLAQ